MSLLLYHQVGHNASWNVQSHEGEDSSDGLILSPVHQGPGMINALAQDTRSNSLFDPQFYLPSSQKPKLLQYDFFPDNIAEGGFSTTSFEASVKTSAELCMKFQREMGFRRLCVPTRFIDQMYSNYIDRQRAFSVDAFIAATFEDEEVCVSIAVTAPMLEDEGFRTKLLSWLTSYPNVRELCLTYSAPRDTKQIRTVNLLLACHRLGVEMQAIGLDLTWSHQNTEAFLFTAQGDVAVSMGSFENTRIFSTDKFVVTDEDRRGPKARIYLRGLLNWVQIDQAKEIRRKLPKLWTQIYFQTTYADAALAQVTEPTFNQPQLYNTTLLILVTRSAEIDAIPTKDRKEYLRERVEAAQGFYGSIEKTIALEKHGQGTHLASWLQAVKASESG